MFKSLTTTSTKPKDMGWGLTLEALAERNGTVELSALTVAGEDLGGPTFRLRALAFDADGVTIERPVGQSGASDLRVGTPVRILAFDGSQRWELSATIESFGMFPLNAQQDQAYLRVHQIREARSAQRRNFFRVNTERLPFDPVIITPLEMVCFPPKTFGAKLMNLGGGGAGVLVPQEMAATFKRGMQVQAVVRVPTIAQPLHLLARVVHIGKAERGQVYLGLRFDSVDDFGIDEICRFTAWHQRQQSQVKRGG